MDNLSKDSGKVVNTRDTERLRDDMGRLLPGQPPMNPDGRPKGTFSLKTLIINKLKEQPELREKLIADLLEKEQGLLIQMIDGRPKQDVEVAHKEAPTPIINLGNLTKDANGVVISDASAVPLLE